MIDKLRVVVWADQHRPANPLTVGAAVSWQSIDVDADTGVMTMTGAWASGDDHVPENVPPDPVVTTIERVILAWP